MNIMETLLHASGLLVENIDAQSSRLMVTKAF